MKRGGRKFLQTRILLLDVEDLISLPVFIFLDWLVRFETANKVKDTPVRIKHCARARWELGVQQE